MTNPPERCSKSTCVCNKNQNIKTHEKKMIELKGEIETSRIIVKDLHTQPSESERTTKKKINKFIEDHKNTPIGFTFCI